jgi:hypothetical protein
VMPHIAPDNARDEMRIDPVCRVVLFHRSRPADRVVPLYPPRPENGPRPMWITTPSSQWTRTTYW